MKKKPIRSDVKLPMKNLWLCLVVALVIASASFAVGIMLGDGNNPPHVKEKSSEGTQGTSFYPLGSHGNTGYGGALVATGLAGSSDPYCVVVAVDSDDTLDKLASEGKAIRIPGDVCVAFSLTIAQMLMDGTLTQDQVTYDKYRGS